MQLLNFSHYVWKMHQTIIWRLRNYNSFVVRVSVHKASPHLKCLLPTAGLVSCWGITANFSNNASQYDKAFYINANRFSGMRMLDNVSPNQPERFRMVCYWMLRHLKHQTFIILSGFTPWLIWYELPDVDESCQYSCHCKRNSGICERFMLARLVMSFSNYSKYKFVKQYSLQVETTSKATSLLLKFCVVFYWFLFLLLQALLYPYQVFRYDHIHKTLLKSCEVVQVI